jgi:adenine-specific DNA-methyltransferase
MARKPQNSRTVATLTHEEARRKNIPTAEYQSVMQKEEQNPIRVAYERRNRDLDPQLVWRGKDEQDWSDLVVHAPPLYIQEKVHPKVLIDDLLRQTREQREHEVGAQPDLFADFNGIPTGVDRTEFYRHEQNWSNRMILGDSLQVMASLAEREGLRGKVQCIYLDPPYGIGFNSNFQWSTTSNDVTDGKTEHITREPEQVKAFRDTWRDGINSYLTYLRDRFTVARDLLSERGSIFVQIGDENKHRVRALLDEVFGEKNFVTEIAFSTTTGFETNYLSSIYDVLLWYAKSKRAAKFHGLYRDKVPGEPGATKYRQVSTFSALANSVVDRSEFVDLDQITSQDESGSDDNDFLIDGKSYPCPKGLHWKTYPVGRIRLWRAHRVFVQGNTPRYLRKLTDSGNTVISNVWTDIGGVQSRSDPKVYVVQTATEVIARAILMTTDPGDLVLDPTCGAGTTARVAEQ